MKKADYSIATEEEREDVVRLLQKNVNEIIEQKKTQHPERLRQAVDAICERVRAGEVFTGKDFQQLVQLFQKKSIV